MFIRQDGSVVRVQAPAKLNLFLEILAKRADGYHEIETLMVAVSRYDTLTFRAHHEPGIALSCRGNGSRDGSRAVVDSGTLPEDERDNLVYKALRLLQARSGCELGGVATLTKRIPAASGLGGGSSDAAAALLAGNIAWNLNWPRDALAKLAAELGSDVPFFLATPTGRGAMMAVCRGRGEVVEPAVAPAGMHFVVARPELGLSTPEVYRHCRAEDHGASVDDLLTALRKGESAKAGALMTNRLQVPAARVSPVVEEMNSRFDGLGAIAHQLSGSGSAYFGWFHHAKAARRAAMTLRATGVRQVWHAQAI